MTAKIPPGFAGITPYLYIRNAAEAMRFYQQAFGAVETMRLATPDGSVMHAEMRIGEAHFMLSEEMPDMGAKSPTSLGGAGVGLMFYVEDVDALFDQAFAAGATVVRPVMDQFWGDRMGTLEDPFGHKWSLATHVEDVSPEEIQTRFATFMREEMGEG